MFRFQYSHVTTRLRHIRCHRNLEILCVSNIYRMIMSRNVCLIGFIVGCMLLILYSSYRGTIMTKLLTEGFSEPATEYTPFAVSGETDNMTRLGLYRFDRIENGEPAYTNGRYYIFYDNKTGGGWQWNEKYDTWTGEGPTLTEIPTAQEFVTFRGYQVGPILERGVPLQFERPTLPYRPAQLEQSPPLQQNTIRHEVVHSGGITLSQSEDYESTTLSQNMPQLSVPNTKAMASAGSKFYTGFMNALQQN